MTIMNAQDGRGAETTAAARHLLASFASWPFLRVERRGARALLYGAVRGDLFATLDLSTGALAVDGGARLDVLDGVSRHRAEALVRRHLACERFAPQLRVASP
jgi:hypothetical protein